MKKTLLVLATLAATAGLAQAATVTLYGAADAGLVYNYTKFKGSAVFDGERYSSKVSEDRYGLESGNYGASKWGLKGEEDLGNGYKVGFKLENGFSLDDGRAGQDGRLFGREASLTVSGPFGALSAGRMGALTSGAGTYDIFQAYGDVFDGGVADIGAGMWVPTSRYDNMLTYATPNMGGLTIYAQYSFQTEGSEKANERANDRYWGLGATFEQGPLALVAVVDSVKPANVGSGDDNYTISLGGNYDFGSFKLYAAGQYGTHLSLADYLSPIKDSILEAGMSEEDYDEAAEYISENINVKGYALNLGTAIPLPCGELKASVWYAHKKVQDTTVKFDQWGVGVVHAYPLSKRTTFYSGVGANYGKLKASDEGDWLKVKATSAQVLFGLNHTF